METEIYFTASYIGAPHSKYMKEIKQYIASEGALTT